VKNETEARTAACLKPMTEERKQCSGCAATLLLAFLHHYIVLGWESPELKTAQSWRTVLARRRRREETQFRV
jgi:hypothetical protein